MGAITVTQLGKAYRQYPTRWSRLLEWIVPFSRPRHRLKWVLRDVSFSLRQGEAVGIVGINGSGKSTLLKLVTGTVQPTTGQVRMSGHVAALLELGMGFHPDFTGRQNVFMAGQLLGFKAEKISGLLPAIEDFADIGEYIDQPVRVYSSGMLVRLAFAVATAVRPDILIVDEALSVGDAYFQHKCFARIRQFQDEGMTLLFVSHDLAAVRALCTRAVWLDKGHVRDIGETKDVLEAYTTELYAREQGLEAPARQEAPDVAAVAEEKRHKRDCRQDFINNSCLRNDIQVFDFKRTESAWGAGQAKILDVCLRGVDGTPLSWVIGGEEVVLSIEANALEDLQGIMVGFMVRDRLGQDLFGDNTYVSTLDSPVNISAGQTVKGTFSFIMPTLPQGTYAVAVAVATGSQKDHVIHEWINDAFFFESQNSTSVSGLVGIPMYAIEVSVVGDVK